MPRVPLSTAALKMQRVPRTVWGTSLCLAGGALFLVDWWPLGIIILLVGLPLAITGALTILKARKFNHQDATIAQSIEHELGQLLIQPATAAYSTTTDQWEVAHGSVVELQRHFDQDTAGGLQGTLNHRFSVFSSSFGYAAGHGGDNWFGAATLTGTRGFLNGISNVDLSLNSTTRDNLMGDALFSVLEFSTASGSTDTMRLISTSQPAAASWLGNLTANVGNGLGGDSTHAGSAVLGNLNALVNHFMPRDISYTTDRLMALERRSRTGDAPTIHAIGHPVGRNAMLATKIRFPDGQSTHLFPVQFPDLLGRAMGLATSQAFASLEPGKRKMRSKESGSGST